MTQAPHTPQPPAPHSPDAADRMAGPVVPASPDQVPRVPVSDDAAAVSAGTRKGLLMVGSVVVLLSLVAEAVVEMHPHFGFDGIFGFHAVFSIAACLALLVLSKVLAVFVKRKDTYYDN